MNIVERIQKIKSWLIQYKREVALTILVEVIIVGMGTGAVIGAQKALNCESKPWKEPVVQKFEVVKVESNNALLLNEKGQKVYKHLVQEETLMAENEKYIFSIASDNSLNIAFYATPKEAVRNYRMEYEAAESIKVPLRFVSIILGVFLVAALQKIITPIYLDFLDELPVNKKKEI